MAVQVKVDLRGVMGGLRMLKKDTVRQVEKGLDESARVVQSQSRVFAPVSPTRAQAASDPLYRHKAGRSPGTLQNSITIRKGRLWRDVGIMTGSALAYARRIHDRIGWSRRGPGTRAKGSRAGAFFLTRALKKRLPDVRKLINRRVGKAAVRFNRG